jgi:hypothetical protein
MISKLPGHLLMHSEPAKLFYLLTHQISPVKLNQNLGAAIISLYIILFFLYIDWHSKRQILCLPRFTQSLPGLRVSYL